MISHAAASAAASSSHASVATALPLPQAPVVVSRRSALLGAVSSAALVVSAPPLPLARAAPALLPRAPPPPYCGVAPSIPNWAFAVPWHESSSGAQSTWYRDVNGPPPPLPGLSPSRPFDPKKLPLVVVHGGPGLPSDYLSSLELLAGAGRRVVFYDQAGCGRSAGVRADAGAGGEAGGAGAIAFYKRELDRLVRRDLGISGPLHLLGHGWGGILALEYAAEHGASGGGVASVVAASTPAAYADLVEGRRAAAARALGAQGAARLEAADAALASAPSAAAATASSSSSSSSSTSLEELRELAQKYDAQVVCRALGGGGAAFDASGPRACVAAARAARARPAIVAGSGAGAGASAAALVRRLNGGRFFEAAGELAGWTAPALPAGVAVLATRGEFDEVPASSADALVRRAKDGGAASSSKAVTFPGAGSYAHLDAWEPYCAEVETWLSGVEGSAVSLTA
jgi:pimeloyl-ACP methyl ester carboxylesterase